MKLSRHHKFDGFTLSEMMMSVAIGTFILAAVLVSSVALQKSLAAVDNFFDTHMQQIRIMDYLGRDVRRSTIVNTSVDLQTVNCTIPDYIIKAGDPDATGTNIGTRRTPTISQSVNVVKVNYGTTTTTVVFSISGNTILRTENGSVTTIASSTDQLVAKTTDVQLANTEYTASTVTFLPIFTHNDVSMERTGTTAFATAYLRNMRRGN